MIVIARRIKMIMFVVLETVEQLANILLRVYMVAPAFLLKNIIVVYSVVLWVVLLLTKQIRSESLKPRN